MEVTAPELPKPRFALYPYQVRWIQDPSRLKIAVKSRRIGYSFATGFRALRSCLQYKHNVIVLSKKEELAKEFIAESVAPHARALGMIASYAQGYIPQTSIYKQECQIANGSRIIALTANPDSARSYEGDVVLDEFAFHQDTRKVYEAIEPSITRGYGLEIISTPNGQQGEFFELAKAAGLVDGIRQQDCEWSAHKTDIHNAVRQGCKDRLDNRLDIATIRAGCLDEEMWLQEYCCAFLSIASQWIPPDLLQANIDRGASVGPPPPGSSNLYAGWDVARSRDLSVVWFTERVGDISWTRGLEVLNGPTPDQMNRARQFMPMVRRLCIDKGVMGLSMFETLEREFPGKVEGVQFSAGVKEQLAVYGKRRLEETKCRIPDDDTVRYSFASVKKTTSVNGNVRFDAEHDERHGHADHWWAFCLAESAFQQQPTYHFATDGGMVGRPMTAGMMTRII